MIVTKLIIKNFRGIKNASLYFTGHTLLVGKNNVGKSTIFEALDLVLGSNRTNGIDVIDEYDFYNGEYYSENGDNPEIEVEVILTKLSSELKSSFGGHIEFWNFEKKKLLSTGEIERTDDDNVEECLRIKFIGKYDQNEDEFIGETFYSYSPDAHEGELTKIYKSKKREIGFLYLRTLRTGSRALSLERGTLLDVLLRIGELRPKFWEETRSQLLNLDPPLDANIGSLRSVLDNIEQRIGQYINLPKSQKSTTLHVSRLTREHLRKTLSFFVTTSKNQTPVPFQKLGTGTLSTLVFALLSAIAELKKENVIFAMEEPEIAVPPHTQRRITNYLLENTTQAFVTSHSPYVIEIFNPSDIKILNKDDDAMITGVDMTNGSGIKPKTYKSRIRHAISEVILGNAVIIGEGLTEHDVLSVISKKMERKGGKYPLDLSGVTIFDAGGDSFVIKFGEFFKSIGIKTYAFFDNMKNRTEDEYKKFDEIFEHYVEIEHKSIEKLLVEEVPIKTQWKFLNKLDEEEGIGFTMPENKPSDLEVKKITKKVLAQKKGEERSAMLVEMCKYKNLPSTITDFLETIYSEFPQPDVVEPINFDKDDVGLNSNEEE